MDGFRNLNPPISAVTLRSIQGLLQARISESAIWINRAADAALVVIMGLWATFHQPTPLAIETVGVLSMAGVTLHSNRFLHTLGATPKRVHNLGC